VASGAAALVALASASGNLKSFDHLVGDGKQRWRHHFDEKYAPTDEWAG
jgi:hypothetical protein